MKTMKTWEIYKEVDEAIKNGTIEKYCKNKFKLLTDDYYLKTKINTVCKVDEFLSFWTLSKNGVRQDFYGFEEWELVKTEPKRVSFLEAINSGKYIKPVIEGNGEVYKKFRKPNEWLEMFMFTLDQINDQWLIEDEENE